MMFCADHTNKVSLIPREIPYFLKYKNYFKKRLTFDFVCVILYSVRSV